jgi:hypothetical protein
MNRSWLNWTYYPGILLERLNKTTKSLRTARSPAEIRTAYLPNTGVERAEWDSVTAVANSVWGTWKTWCMNAMWTDARNGLLQLIFWCCKTR